MNNMARAHLVCKLVEQLENIKYASIRGEYKRSISNPQILDRNIDQGLLYLTGLGLPRLPEILGHGALSDKIKDIRLYSNALQSIDCIGGYHNLEQAHLDDNLLTEIPEFIKDMRSLKVLRFGRNNVTKIPNWLADMPELKVLDLSYNPIEKYPIGLVEKINFVDLTAIKARKPRKMGVNG